MDYKSIFYGVLGYFGKAIVVIGAFYFGRHFANLYKPKWKNYFVVFVMIGVFSLVMWSIHGMHNEGGDPIFGGGEFIVDFEPTAKERNEYGFIVFLTLIIPALIGVYKGKPKS